MLPAPSAVSKLIGVDPNVELVDTLVFTAAPASNSSVANVQR
jgi:hypothetical protein